MAPHSNTSLILLCSTSYDEITCFLSRLLTGFSYSGKTVHHVQLEKPDVSYRNILADYQQGQEKVVLVFCGNAEEDALLTGLKQDCSDLNDSLDEGVFYDSDYFDSGPTTLAAFSSYAGKYLGPAFAKATAGNFLGFCDELWLFPDVSDECNSWWHRILNRLIIRIVDDESIDEQTIDFVRSVYQEAYNYFCSEESGLAKEALGMRMCLRQNLSALCNY
ncbi:MAG TPA: hypothetical protein VE135_15575 [Pyrinomonadaceae bacterium]|nr:hypothetical protein [Pyrinomonadaceae bacterium]